MFQCCLTKDTIFGYVNDIEIVEDTGLITWEEAVELWEKWRPKVVKQLEDGQNPEMAIWTGCKDTSDYHTDPFHVDRRTEVEDGRFIEVVKNVIDPTKVTMGEPS